MPTIRLTTRLTGVSPLTDDQIIDAIMATNPKRPAFTRQVLKVLLADLRAIGLRGDIWAADAALETGNFTSALFVTYGNIGGLAAFDDGTYAGGTFTSPEAAAHAFAAHAMAYVYGRALPLGARWVTFDPRWDDALDRVKTFGRISEVGHLGNGNWATNPDHATALVARYAALFGRIKPTTTASEQPQKESESVSRPKVLLIAGHRSYNDAGNPNEKDRTPALAAAYYTEFASAGYEVWWLQRDVDGDADPDDTVGGLDTVSMKAYQWGVNNPGDLVLLDLHYEGAYARGHFAIVPDITGLGTAITLPQLSTDTWANNILDRKVGREWADRMRAITGLPYRSSGVVEPGLMSETQTGVAIQYDARLATFAYTSAHRDRMVRLVLEHGSLLMADDLAIINAAGFPSRAAVAGREAVDAAYGITTETPPATEEPPVEEEKHTLPAGMTEQLARRYYKSYVAPWGKTYEFDLSRAASQVWLARGKKSIPAGGTFEDGKWPFLVEVIRRGIEGDQGEVYRWSDGSTYWSKPK